VVAYLSAIGGGGSCQRRQQEAIEQIYMAVKGDMRKFKEICTDCRDRAKELNYKFVDLNLALEFIVDLPPH